jgi:hypothetical protein
MINELILKGIVLRPHKAYKNSDFTSKAVHVSDKWDYVESWLRNHTSNRALTFWIQAKSFKDANNKVDRLSQPLTSYYCILNMVKALLISKGVDLPQVINHGLTGKSEGIKNLLTNEYVILKNSGVLSQLCYYFDETIGDNEQISIDDLLYNLPFIHRAYCISNGTRRDKELFIPVVSPRFYKIEKPVSRKNSYFCGELTDSWSATQSTINKIPDSFELVPDTEKTIRFKDRFEWSGRAHAPKVKKLELYNKKLRNKIFYIHGCTDRIYLKRNNISGVVNHNNIVISFAILHRLSELCRYNPESFNAHYRNRYNWLLDEFLKRVLEQMVDEISAEITGQEIN